MINVARPMRLDKKQKRRVFAIFVAGQRKQRVALAAQNLGPPPTPA